MPVYRPPGGGLCAWLTAAVFVLVTSGAAVASEAPSVRILAAGAAQGVLLKLEPAIAAASGHKLDASFDTVGALRDRVLGGEMPDVVILSAAGMTALEKAGKLAPGSTIDLGSISVALAVRKGAPVPDIASPDALTKALLAARSIAHADPARGATAGMHFASVLERLAIADQLRSRVTVLAFGGSVIEAVAQGRFEMGVSQSSEIAAHPGVTLVGSLPPPYDRRTRYAAAKPAGASARADAVLEFLQTAAARSQFAALGFSAAP
jgi:molybdate transport system substrate-binding protein